MKLVDVKTTMAKKVCNYHIPNPLFVPVPQFIRPLVLKIHKIFVFPTAWRKLNVEFIGPLFAN